MGPVDRNGLEILERAECLQLLATAAFGRLAYSCGGIPAVVPVNVASAHDRMLFRLGAGAALAAIYDRQLLTLEVDAIDLDACCGWSVNIVGTPGGDPRSTRRNRRAGAQVMVAAESTRLFSLRTDHVEGRRLAPPRPPISARIVTARLPGVAHRRRSSMMAGEPSSTRSPPGHSSKPQGGLGLCCRYDPAAGCVDRSDLRTTWSAS